MAPRRETRWELAWWGSAPRGAFFRRLPVQELEAQQEHGPIREAGVDLWRVGRNLGSRSGAAWPRGAAVLPRSTGSPRGRSPRSWTRSSAPGNTHLHTHTCEAGG